MPGWLYHGYAPSGGYDKIPTTTTRNLALHLDTAYLIPINNILPVAARSGWISRKPEVGGSMVGHVSIVEAHVDQIAGIDHLPEPAHGLCCP